MSRAEQLNKKYDRVRVTYDLFNCTPGTSGPRSIDVWWLEDESNDEWAKFDDGRCTPFRLPLSCITNVQPL